MHLSIYDYRISLNYMNGIYAEHIYIYMSVYHYFELRLQRTTNLQNVLISILQLTLQVFFCMSRCPLDTKTISNFRLICKCTFILKLQ